MDAASRCAISDTIHQFFWLIDNGRADETVNLLTPSATLEYGPGSPRPGLVSGAALQDMMTDRAKQTHITSRHVISNLRFNFRRPECADVDWVMTVYRSETASRDSYPTFVADVKEILVKQGDRWLTDYRTMIPVFFSAMRSV